MKRFAAFLRGVSPMNASMPELKKAFEGAGFADVVTLLSSGNVVFSATAESEAAVARKAEAAMKKRLGRTFLTFVRPVETLRAVLAENPYRRFTIEPGAKRIITFLAEAPTAKLRLPIEHDGALILAVQGREVFSVYEPSSRGPVFMTLLEKTFGKAITTRTWDTVRKAAK